MIRQFGDKLLQRKIPLYPFDNMEELNHQLQIMRFELYQSGGVGIAANQCQSIEKPYQIVIIGSNDPKARMLAKQRYPQRELPSEIVMINPKILAKEGTPYYPGEGCLSVKGSLRAKVMRYPQVTVSYFNLDGEQKTETYHNFVAHIIQHEVDHLIGMVFLELVLAELTPAELQAFTTLIDRQLNTDQSVEESINAQPMFAFQRDEHAHLFIDESILSQSLLLMENHTLQHIKNLIEKQMKHRAA